MEEQKFTLVEHLGELRKRLMIIAVVVIASTLVCYNYVNYIIELVLLPANGLEFVYLTPPELFLAYVKLALIAGIAITSPITISQLWFFVRPGLEKKEKRMILLALISGALFFATGVAFAYKVILPITINFFVKLKLDGIEPMFSFGSYIGFINSILLAFGLVFEMPIVVVLLTKLNIITANTLKKNRKFFILAIVVVAALLTPPDVVSQMLLAAPMLVLFELSIVLSTIVGKKSKE